jgi:hypothetical protein
MRIEVYKVLVEPTKLYSEGMGFDDCGAPIEFIGFTKEIANIGEAIEDYEDDNTIGRPTIYLKPWQLKQ